MDLVNIDFILEFMIPIGSFSNAEISENYI